MNDAEIAEVLEKARQVVRLGPGAGKTREELFWAKVDKNGPIPIHCPELGACWLWTAATIRGGYGAFWRGDQHRAAHRFSYERLIGPIPKGLTLDHLCRRPPCVNPRHLQPVTEQVNILRGTSPAAMNAIKTHCIRGHALDGANLRVSPEGYRVCRTCQRDAMREHRARQRGSA